MNLTDVIARSPVAVHPERFAVRRFARDASAPPAAFLVTRDATEMTVIAAERDCAGPEPLDSRSWFRLLEFRVCVPFEAPGFLAAICAALAARGVNVLVVSTFSRDYVLVAEADLETGLQAITRAGFTVLASA